MITNILKNIRSSKPAYPKNFISIVDNLQDQYKKEDNIVKIWKAYELAKELHKGQKRASGEPYFTHCENVGLILSKWGIDIDTIIAGLLHDSIEDTSISRDELTKEFNPDQSLPTFSA